MVHLKAYLVIRVCLYEILCLEKGCNLRDCEDREFNKFGIEIEIEIEIE